MLNFDSLPEDDFGDVALDDYERVEDVSSAQELCYMYPSIYQAVEGLLDGLCLKIDDLTFQELKYFGEVEEVDYFVYFQPKNKDYAVEVSVKKLHEMITEKDIWIGRKDEIFSS